jgi:hypothetical protein
MFDNFEQVSHLNEYQIKYISEIKKIKVSMPFSPWKHQIYIDFEGILACGWTKDNYILMISYDGYKVIDPINGETINEDFTEISYNLMSSNNQSYNAKIIDECVNVFGIYGGRGNLVSSDGWKLNILYPYWPNSIVSIGKSQIETSDSEIWKNIRLIKLSNLEYNSLNCGFSPDENYFLILGTEGVEVFSRIRNTI